MNTKHTPGPWELMGSGPEVTRTPDNSRVYISSPSGGWYEFTEVCVTLDGEDSPEGIANARLIASAPDLLEALEALLDDYVPATQDQELAQYNALEAIRKAKRIQ